MNLKPIYKLVIVFVVLLGLNLLSGKFKFALDLTQDKRFTLSEVTKNMVHDLDKPVQIKVYLESDLNSGFRRLYQGVDLLTAQLKRMNRKNIQVSFVQVDKLSGKERSAFNERVKEYEMLPVNVVDEDNSGKVTQKSIYPWALMRYDNKEMPVKLLMNLGGRSGEENLNTSIENLEYEMVDALRILTTTESEKIAFLEGHNEWDEDHVYDLTTALSRYFTIDRGRVGNSVDPLKPYKALIIAGPQTAFSETEKFVIDQYIMQGGKVLWMVDGVKISADSLQTAPITYGVSNELNLDDMLFSYGVRINPVLVKDLQSARLPVNMAPDGANPDFKAMPWFYNPLFTASNLHPISRNLSPVKGEFSSTIDVMEGNEKVTPTIILATSRQTAIERTPVEVSLSEITQEVDTRAFRFQHLPVAVLLEGNFTSAFLNRMPPASVQMKASDVKSSSVPTSMMVIADGDIGTNNVQYLGSSKRVYPLGFDNMTGSVVYGNKDFLLNALNYLTNQKDIIKLRNRTIPLRLLDKEQANQYRYKWQIINILIPLLVLLTLALINGFVRKKRYK